MYEGVPVEELLLTKKGVELLSKSKKMYISNGKTIEVKKIQMIKVDEMIVFYNAMWSIIAHSCIWGLVGGRYPEFY